MAVGARNDSVCRRDRQSTTALRGALMTLQQMNVRRAVVEDVTELSKLVLDAKAHWGYSNAQLQAWRASLDVSAESISAHPTFIAELNGLAIGFYSLIPSAGAWDLDDLWVLPAFMKKGVGRKLLMHAAQVAALGGATSILIESDPNAEPFYVACGANRIGEVAAPIPGEPQRVRPLLTFDTIVYYARDNTAY
jgi:GNAT superfamily N-acetyltransferase